jgi:hypothetical protein
MVQHSKLFVDGLVEWRGDVFCIGGNKDQVGDSVY